MGFLSGPVSFEAYRVRESETKQFGAEEIKTLESFAIGQIETASLDQPVAGFLAGGHLFDLDFDLEKNVIGDALHCGVRIDTNQVPAAIRKAWLQMELAAAGANNPSGRPTKAQRQEAKEAVAARCEDEAKDGRYRKMQFFPFLWDLQNDLFLFGGTSATAAELSCDLFCGAFEIEMQRLTAGRRALEWATDTKHRKQLEEISPSVFQSSDPRNDIVWWNAESGNFDFLGNEFLLWLWWFFDTESDTVQLPDDTEVTGMFAKTLSLQCPHDESGKETITAESPVKLPEAELAIRSGKLPRKAGLILARQGEQYELVLQAETFAISGAKIVTEEKETSDGERNILDDRIESVRSLNETVDLLFRTFCDRRIAKNWSTELGKIRRWLKSSE
jgi:hypothetical protein